MPYDNPRKERPEATRAKKLLAKGDLPALKEVRTMLQQKVVDPDEIGLGPPTENNEKIRRMLEIMGKPATSTRKFAKIADEGCGSHH
ncbi:hypothetical protein C4544_01570 [candidate division WS5 bacterium]|uniref:Uncharacterized protein n=1 Tax=candidate division WS5 bacterium TaxID=2093353 RepID=A0A419DFF7_9BACT|nr:MAG: hypothetical protein C4544_01570 [candidate division WS5 bacterium]